MQEFLNTKNREGTENLAPKPHLLPKPKGTASERGRGLCSQKQQLWNVGISGANPQVTFTSLKSYNYL